MKSVSTLPILVVDDEPRLLHSVSVALRGAGFPQVVTVDDTRKVAPLLSEQPVGAVLLDLSMPELSGRTLLDQVTADYPDVPVIVLTATNDLETAVACMQAGAKDYLVKPVEASRLISALKRVIEVRALEAELLSLKARVLEDTPHERTAFTDIITHDRTMFAIFRYLEAIAPSPQPVLITGETGTGKELVARALHRLSGRSGDLVTVNTAGLDDTLFTDSLFGHTRGAFTGADRARDGLVNVAGDGTLFLDEIGELAMASQVKLLRLLQDGGYYPLGADRPRQCRARIIVATNRDVARAVAEGAFRNDLYYRLRIHHFALPPLRARLDDLPLLVSHFVERAATTLGKPAPAAPAALYTLLRTHPFPGNVRELEAMVFDAVARQKGSMLGLQSFRDAIEATSPPIETPGAGTPTPMEDLLRDRLPTLDEAQDTLVAEALRRAEGNQGIAARMLGLSRQALNKRLARRKVSGRTP
jgi:two-component system nitrogen regulation response regulator GlnG